MTPPTQLALPFTDPPQARPYQPNQTSRTHWYDRRGGEHTITDVTDRRGRL